MIDDLVLRGTAAEVRVAPTAGGRVAQIEVVVEAGRRVHLLVDDTDRGHPNMWGMFPMTPWAGRLRDATFDLAGTTFDMDPNLPPHAIHGLVYDRPWQVDDRGDASLTLSCPLEWPLGGRAVQHLELHDHGLSCELSVSADEHSFPAEVGWHPWFVRPRTLEFHPEAMYLRGADGLPTGELVAPTDGPWDDCFVNRRPAELHYDHVVVTVESDCDHWVVYDEPDDATCVEPQSGPPDAFHLAPRVIAPGRSLRRTMRVTWAAPARPGAATAQ